jgi:hypothetical protein
MTLDLLTARLNQIEARVTSPSFLKAQGLGNEVPFHIFDYPAEHELAVRDYLQVLLKALQQRHALLRVAEANLFQVIVDLLKKRGLYDRVVEWQRTKGDEATLRNLRGVLDEGKIAKALAELVRPDQHQLVIIHGIGTAWPLIRAHQLIKSLESMTSGTPFVFFYPGTYSGLNLVLFDRLNSKDHYRAFRLIS